MTFDTQKGLDSILGFSSHLRSLLSDSSPTQADLSKDFCAYFHVLPIPQETLSAQQRLSIRECAVALWNACNIRDESEFVSQEIDILAKAKALAFLLLESAAKWQAKCPSTHLDDQHQDPVRYGAYGARPRYFHVGVDAARCCLAVSVLDIALKVLETLAERYDALLDHVTEPPVSAEEHTELRVRYLCLRVTLEWKRGRLDLANYWNSRIESIISTHTVPDMLLGSVLDMLYEIGREQLSKQQYESAAVWLKAARTFLISFVSTTTEADADLVELRMNVLHLSVRTLLCMKTPEARNEALHIMEELKAEYGDKFAVMLLQLEVLNQISPGSVKAFSSGNRVEENHQIGARYRVESQCARKHLLHNLRMDADDSLSILHHLHILKSLSIDDALDCLHMYITARLAYVDTQVWMDNAIVTYIWMACDFDSAKGSNVPAFRSSLDAFNKVWHQPLSSEAAHAGLVFIWRQIETSAARSVEAAAGWCHVGLHDIFKHADDHHIAVIERKLITLHLESREHESAQRTLDQMTPNRRTHHLSYYAAYRIALVAGDEYNAQSILLTIASLVDLDKQVLHACIAETVKHDSKMQASRLLQRLLDKYIGAPTSDIDLPALFRCTTQLLISAVENHEAIRDEALSRLCVVFKAVATYSTSRSLTNNAQTITLPSSTCRWFKDQSFALAVKHWKDWPSKSVIDLLQYSKLIKDARNATLRDGNPTAVNGDHDLEVTFIQAVLYTKEARSVQASAALEHLPRTSFDSRDKPDPAHIRRVLYKNAFDQSLELLQAFDKLSQDQIAKFADATTARLHVICVLAFEALLYLNLTTDTDVNTLLPFDYLSLTHVVKQTERFQASSKTYAVMADLILSHAIPTDTSIDDPQPRLLPLQPAVVLLTEVVQALQNIADYDIYKAARWTRCIFQLITEMRPPDDEATKFALLNVVVDQALLLARSSLDPLSDASTHDPGVLGSGDTQVYSCDELTYLSTILFNMAVDLFVGGKEDQAKDWAGRAIQFADILARGSDGELLAKVLRDKTRDLGWDL